jgi:probable phosphoglycerate mutase
VGAELAAHRHEIGVEIDDRLVEIDYGTYDGLRPDELPRDVWSAWRDDPGFRPPGGETLIELQSRCSELYDELRTKALAAGPRGAEVVVAVCHVSPIKAAVSWALGTGPEIAWRLNLAIASITRLSLGPGRPALLSFGETAHLTRTDPAEGRVGL